MWLMTPPKLKIDRVSFWFRRCMPPPCGMHFLLRTTAGNADRRHALLDCHPLHALLVHPIASPPLHQSSPAPRAHLYFAPSTATGISVVYGYAGTPCWNRNSA